MRLTSGVQGRFDGEEKILTCVYDLMEPNVASRQTAAEIGALTDLRPATVQAALSHFSQMGLIKTEVRYNVDGGSTGRSAWITPLKPSKGLALELLESEHRRELLEGPWNAAKLNEYRDRVALQRKDNPDDPLKAVVGPDAPNPMADLAPLRKSEPRALIESAKQYRGRKDLKTQKLKELRDGGITISDEAIPLPIDERLEVLLLVLPYVERLERHEERIAQYADRYRELEAKYNETNRNYEALKRWRDNQVSRTIDQVSSRYEGTNGHPVAGATGDRAEDRAGSTRPNGSEDARPAESPVGEGEARPAQPRSETETPAG